MKRILSAAFILCLLFCAAGCSDETGYVHISQDKAAEIMDNDPDCIILDVRTQEEYDEEHIKGAVCIPVDSIGEDATSLLPDKNAVLLVYCRSGNRSRQASEKLAALGYTAVYEFGGINTWSGETE